MSLRLALALLLFAVAIIMTLRRPFWGLITIIVLYHLRLEIYGTGLQDVRFQLIATAALIMSYALHRRDFREEPGELRMPQIRILWVFTVYIFLTSRWAVYSTTVAFDGAVDFLKVVIFCWLLMKIVRNEREMKVLVWVILGASCYTAFIGFWGVEWGLLKEHEMGIGNNGTNPHFILLLPLLLLLSLKAGTKLERICAFSTIPFMLLFFTVAGTGYRSAVLMLATAIMLFLFFSPMSMKLRVFIPLAIAGGLYAFVLAPPGYWDYMKTILQPTAESSSTSRFVINSASLQIFSDYPFGIGWENYTQVSADYLPERFLSDGGRSAHNTYLSILCETGFIGLALWVAIFSLTWLSLHHIRKQTQNLSGPCNIYLWAFGFEMGLPSIMLGIAVHDRQNFDTLYWFVAFSVILNRLLLLRQETIENSKPEATVVPTVSSFANTGS